MDRLPRELKDRILEFLPREDLMTMRLVHSSFLAPGDSLLFRQLHCTPSRLKEIALVDEIADLRNFVNHITLYDHFPDVARVPHYFPFEEGFPMVSSVKIVPPFIGASQAVDPFFDLGMLLFTTHPKITRLAAKYLSQVVWREIAKNITAWRPFWNQLMSLELHFCRSRNEWLTNLSNHHLHLLSEQMTISLSETMSLRCLHLNFDTIYHSDRNFQPGVKSLTSLDKSWPKLQELNLRGMCTKGQDFEYFLIKHKHTLEVLRLCNIDFLPNSEDGTEATVVKRASPHSFITFLGKQMNLKTCAFSGDLRDCIEGGYGHLPNKGRDDGAPLDGGEEEARRLELHMLSQRTNKCVMPTCHGSCLMVCIQRYITHRGSWPGFSMWEEEQPRLLGGDESWGFYLLNEEIESESESDPD